MSMLTLPLPMPTVSESALDVLIDVATYGHLAAMAAGCGAVFFADSTLIGKLSRPVRQSHVATVDHAHAIISWSIFLLWVTGLALLGLKTGFDPANVTPKLLTKLGTVAVLTVTATAMARFALPYLRANIGRRLIDAPLGQQCLLALCAAMSASGWLTALLLGSSRILKTAGDEVMVLGASLHGLAVGGALALAICLHALRHGLRPAATAVPT